MNPLFATLFIILAALLGARLSFSTERIPAGPRLLFRTGTHFLVIGFLLGPAALGLLTGEATTQLMPFVALGLGWVGFQFGLQLEWESLRRFPFRYYLVAGGQAALAFLVFYGMGRLGLAWAGLDGKVPRLLLLGAAATASVTTPAGIAMVSSNFLVRGKVRDLLFLTGSLDAAIGIIALQAVYAVHRPPASVPTLGQAPGIALVGLALGLGAVCGILFMWLTRPRPESDELVLFLLGISAFSAGAALQLGLSPLFVSVTMGAVVANVGTGRERMRRVLTRWEKPVYVAFLLMAGAILRFPTPWVIVLAVAYALLRAVAKSAGAAVLVTAVPLGFAVPRRFGLGLIPQGGISLAMAVSGVLTYPHLPLGGRDGAEILFATIVLGVVLAELMGPFFTVRVLRRAGEISPRVEAALVEGDERRAEKEALQHAPPTRGRGGAEP